MAIMNKIGDRIESIDKLVFLNNNSIPMATKATGQRESILPHTIQESCPVVFKSKTIPTEINMAPVLILPICILNLLNFPFMDSSGRGFLLD
jgi:hypothetical protein